MKDHYQYHWNDSWDWDEMNAPMVVEFQRDGRDVKGLIKPARNGRTFPGLVHAGRNGYLWVLERSADKITFVDAKPYVYQNVFASLDPVTGRPTYNEGTKPGIDKPGSLCPSLSGGKNWTPAAFSPQSGLLYVPANDNYCTGYTGTPVEYRPGQNFTGTRDSTANLIEGSDHIGELQAWNVNTGEKVWTHEYDMANWGPVLATGGGLVFSGGTADRKFRAFDAATGELLWEQRLNSGITGVPTTFEVAGKQYVALQSGWGVDAMRMQSRIDQMQGRTNIVPQGGVVWVFAVEE
jgi:alcohol dehydrogenase (cytochrome c)